MWYQYCAVITCDQRIEISYTLNVYFFVLLCYSFLFCIYIYTTNMINVERTTKQQMLGCLVFKQKMKYKIKHKTKLSSNVSQNQYIYKKCLFKRFCTQEILKFHYEEGYSLVQGQFCLTNMVSIFYRIRTVLCSLPRERQQRKQCKVDWSS